VPADNPMSIAKVELGRHLFYDRRMSAGQMTSCATCHEQSRAFTDVWPRAIGATWEIHARNTPGLTNIVYNAVLTWANPAMTSLEAQARVPVFGVKPVEMGLPADPAEFLAVLKTDAVYRRLFPAAFPNNPLPYTIDHAMKAIACFERTLISGRSGYDRYHAGDRSAMSESAIRGEALFRSDRLGCANCHSGFNFSNGNDFKDAPRVGADLFFNTGLNIDYARDSGLRRQTGRADDDGKFKVPTLRNIEVTDPYMHDGSVQSLEDVLDHYAAGGSHPNRSKLLRKFQLSSQEKKDVLNFLRSLTDTTFLSDPRLSDPWDRKAN